jgi:hypothetical protein
VADVSKMGREIGSRGPRRRVFVLGEGARFATQTTMDNSLAPHATWSLPVKGDASTAHSDHAADVSKMGREIGSRGPRRRVFVLGEGAR